jgi:hypothetical protein
LFDSPAGKSFWQFPNLELCTSDVTTHSSFDVDFRLSFSRRQHPCFSQLANPSMTLTIGHAKRIFGTISVMRLFPNQRGLLFVSRHLLIPCSQDRSSEQFFPLELLDKISSMHVEPETFALDHNVLCFQLAQCFEGLCSFKTLSLTFVN